MKKNKMMRLASALLVAVLLTTCTISGTYAKYVTTGTTKDYARVAKWGIKVEAEGNAFAEAYDSVDGQAIVTKTQSVISASKVIVDGEENGNVVAPGTSGRFLDTKITGTPEVAYSVSHSFKFLGTSSWEVEGNEFYFPIVLHFYENGVKKATVDGKTFGSMAEFETQVNTILTGMVRKYDANTTVDDGSIDHFYVDWEWPFTTSTENDVKDS